MQLYFGLLAAILLAAAAWVFVRRSKVALRGVGAVGRVVAHEQREDDGVVFYLPIVEFTDRQQALHRFTAVAGHSTRHPAVGASVAVRYLASDPSVALVSSFLHMWAAPLALLLLGLAALVAGVQW